MNRIVDMIKDNKDRIIKGAIVVGSIVAGASVLAIVKYQQENACTEYDNVIDVTDIADDYTDVIAETEE